MEPSPASTPEPRQRWRLTVRRTADAPALAQRELTVAWDAAVDASGLPVFTGDPAKPKPRTVFGAPLTVGMAADAEWLEIVLVERLPAWRVREALAPVVPDGWSLVDLADVWLGGPALAGRVAAADYRVTLAVDPAERPDPGRLEHAIGAILAARSLPRERLKGGSVVRYDLRPLLIDVAVIRPGPPVQLRTRTRLHPELGTGRPEEVVGALADATGLALAIEGIVRERLLLVDELD